MHNRAGLFIASLLAFAPLVGCSESEPPQFRLDMMNVVAKQISPNHQKAIANILGGMFGTPDQPFALPETGLNQTWLNMAAGPVWTDEAGGKHGLYRRHCAHCHGISGDGQGPTASVLNPYPRDYRPGVFKFKSTQTAAKPTNEDLHRILHDGIPNTAMPSFALLAPDELQALAEYVKYLAIRGQMETALENYVFDEGIAADDPFDPSKNADLKTAIMGDMLPAVLEGWQGADEQVIVPDTATVSAADRELAKSITEGRDLFYSSTKGNCIKCHGPTALGDNLTGDYDEWNKANKKFIEDTDKLPERIKGAKDDLAAAKGDDRQAAEQRVNELAKEYQDRLAVIAHLLPLREADPRNLRLGHYRGGRRPVDLYWRIAAGIAGTPMPSAAATEPGGAGLSPEEIWKVIDYVQSLPFEPISRPLKAPTNKETIN
jgi:mono/diheme cytochrome c family protein